MIRMTDQNTSTNLLVAIRTHNGHTVARTRSHEHAKTHPENKPVFEIVPHPGVPQDGGWSGG